MQKKWKQTGAALLIAGLTVTGASYAWADEKAIETIDLSQLGKDSTTDVVEDSTETVEVPKEESVLPEIPEGYTAGNLVALGNAYEKVQNPTAKASIKRNMERFEKWENKQSETETSEQPKIEVPEQPEVKEEPVKQDAPVKQEPVKQEAPIKQEKPAKVKQEKAPQAELNAQHKEQRQELRVNQKVEREALKAESKADKEQQKQVGKEKKN